jgi:Zn finger protein HypA/HybF involved in hydrogenase expression
MGIWQWLFGRSAEPPPIEDEEPEQADDRTVPLPTEPYVFECRDCGKVFEKRRRRPICPECDSPNVELVSE